MVPQHSMKPNLLLQSVIILGFEGERCIQRERCIQMMAAGRVTPVDGDIGGREIARNFKE